MSPRAPSRVPPGRRATAAGRRPHGLPAAACALAAMAALAGCGPRPGSAVGSAAPAASAPLPRRVTTEEVVALTKDPSARLVLLNVWATWCMPCREELPALARLAREMRPKGLKLVLLSVDDQDVTPEKLAEQLARYGIDFETYVRTDDIPTLKKGITPDWEGGIPATFLYGPDGDLRDYWEGKATFEAFVEKVEIAMMQEAG